jgi:hypothetical protein
MTWPAFTSLYGECGLEPVVVPADADVPDADVPDADVPDADVPDADVPDADVPDADVPWSKPCIKCRPARVEALEMAKVSLPASKEKDEGFGKDTLTTTGSRVAVASFSETSKDKTCAPFSPCMPAHSNVHMHVSMHA